MEGEGVHGHSHQTLVYSLFPSSKWYVLQIKISSMNWMERLELPVDQSEIYWWDLSRLQLRFYPAYSTS